MNRKIANYFKSLDTLHEAAVTDYTQSRIVLSGSEMMNLIIIMRKVQ